MAGTRIGGKHAAETNKKLMVTTFINAWVLWVVKRARPGAFTLIKN